MSKMVFIGPKDKISTKYFNTASMKFASKFVEINDESVKKINDFKRCTILCLYKSPFLTETWRLHKMSYYCI